MAYTLEITVPLRTSSTLYSKSSKAVNAEAAMRDLKAHFVANPWRGAVGASSETNTTLEVTVEDYIAPNLELPERAYLTYLAILFELDCTLAIVFDNETGEADAHRLGENPLDCSGIKKMYLGV